MEHQQVDLERLGLFSFSKSYGMPFTDGLTIEAVISGIFITSYI
jgi:hypothetical protein